MNSYSLSVPAANDLFELWAFIAKDDFKAADRLEEEIITSIKRIAARPDLGHFRRDLTDDRLRFFPVRKMCLIVYDPATQPLSIIRILHGSRDAKSELAD